MALKTFPLLCLTVLALSATLYGQSSSGVSEGDRARVQQALAKQAPVFVENRGQWPKSVRFHSRTSGLDMWVTDNGIVYDLYQLRRFTAEVRDKRELGTELSMPTSRTGHVMKMEFVGGTGRATVRGTHVQPGHYNFFQGNDPSRWASNVKLYGETRIEKVYDGIDAVLYYDAGKPRYDIVVHPGGNPDAIRVRYAGAEKVRVNAGGELALTTSLGEMVQQGLFAYQMVDGRKEQVSCSFDVRKDGTVGFTLGSYDQSKPVVIDPILYSTFIGGSGHDNAYALTVDGAGNAYITGYASSWFQGTDSFPTYVGAYDFTFNGGMNDAFVSKIDCNSGNLIFSTFLGGSGIEDGRGIGIDGGFNVYVTGFTTSANFPTTGGAYDRTLNGGHDAFVTKLSPTGSGLFYSTFVGGSLNDGAFALQVNQGGGVTACGFASSSDFPTTAGAHDQTFNGGSDDMVVFNLSPNGSTLTSGTYVGGTGAEFAYAIEVDVIGNTYVCGSTSSRDFPMASPFDPTYNGGLFDGVIVKLGPEVSGLFYSTYLGGSEADYLNGIEVHTVGDLTFCGYTASPNFPTTSGAYSRTYNGGAFDAVVGKLNSVGNSLVYSTFLGGASDDYAYDVLIDNQGGAFVCGKTSSDPYPTTRGAFDSIRNDISYDGFLTQLHPSGSTITYSTLIGGGNEDEAHAILMGNENTIYIAGTTHSEDFPMSWNAFDDTLGRGYIDGRWVYSYDAFVTKLDLRNVVLMQPQRGTMLCRGATFNIRWSQYRVGAVAIRLSSDGGRSYPTLITTTDANLGSYNWTVPASLGEGTYRIRISDQSNDFISDSTHFDLILPPAPVITRQPTTRTVCPGDSASFSADGAGLGARLQWRRNGTNIPGATGRTFRINRAAVSDTGSYVLAVTDTCGTVVTSNVARLEFTPAPTITAGPQTAAVCVGAATTFTATATGADLRYQWKKDGANIPGATDNTYTINSVSASDAGNYTVAITSAVCPQAEAVSLPATLTVERQEITSHPQNLEVRLGQSASFTVTAPGSGLTYQWRKNGVNIPGATNNSFTIPLVDASDSALYDVVVMGRCTTTSNTARLRISLTGSVPGEGVLDGRSIRLTVAPNPASGQAVINIVPALTSRHADGLELALYDLLGRKVLDLTSTFVANGFGTVEFDASTIPSGVYYCRLSRNGWNGLSTMIVVGR